jgi:hypothetical protein
VGLEATCNVRYEERTANGRALLESDVLLFRGDFKLSIPHTDMSGVEAENGELKVTFPGGVAVFELGPAAERWAEKLRSPRSLVDKLGVPEGGRVAVINLEDAELISQLEERAADVAEHAAPPDTDLILWRLDRREELSEMDSLMKCLRPGGAIWVFRQREGGRVSEGMVRSTASNIGMVDVKVLRYSDELTAVKLVSRKGYRGPELGSGGGGGGGGGSQGGGGGSQGGGGGQGKSRRRRKRSGAAPGGPPSAPRA